MSIIHGTYKHGHVELDSPVDWPEGVRVAIQPTKNGSSQTPELGEKFGMSEEDWPTTKEGIEALIADWNAIEPMEMTPEEQAEFEAAQRVIGDYTKQAVAREMGLGK
jgi:hypothetical protein